MNTKILVLLIIFLLPLPSHAIDTDKFIQPLNKFQNKIIKRDDKGRAKVTQATTDYGTCLSEVVYDQSPHPEIHLVIISNGRMKHVGYVLIMGTTQETITNQRLLLEFDLLVKQHCFPLIIPGYTNI